mgnify:CR=1 FL=1
MCGITGIFGTNDQHTIKKMTDSVTHRGPDEVGYYHDDRISLGHARLSIIDLHTGSQPMFNENKNFVVVYNGEIYNYQELKSELEKKGHNFATSSDTEVIVHAYEEYGIESFNMFNGMFAFAIWDSKKKELILARDSHGIKPLYFLEVNKKLLFASEAKAILNSQDIEPEVNIESLYYMLNLRYIPYEQTIFKNIQRLAAGHFLRAKSNGQLEIRKYKRENIHNLLEKTQPHLSFTQDEEIKGKEIMKKIIIYSLAFAILMPLRGDGLQLFGSKKTSEKENKSEQKASSQRDDMTEDLSTTEVATRKNIESVIPVKRIPSGWVFRDELLAPWESNLPAVLSIIPDTTVEVVYHDDNRTTREGFVLPIKRASVEFQYTSRLTHELIMLEFVNVDFIYSTTNNNDSHFILEGITKKVKLKDTGFPQLTSSDIIKHKVLMEYGTPKEFDGVWHIYEDVNSSYKVRELDERNIKVETKSFKVVDKLEKAIDDTYSKQGIEYKKRLMVQGIDI